MSSHSLLESMNEAQKQAVTAPEGPVLVIAGPGSGKTRVLTHRIAYLMTNYRVSAGSIMAVTFTNKAAREMETRVETLVGGLNNRLTLGTFHSICARILRRDARYTPYTPSFTIYDTGDQRSVVKQIIIGLQQDPKKFTPAAVLASISSAKNELITPEQFSVETYADQIKQRVYEQYQQVLLGNNAMDFDDMLVNTVRLFQDNPDVLARYQKIYRHILVDEFQDTNTVQYELVRLLGETHHQLFAVGDPDQSIYAFRGADYRNVRRFEEDFKPLTILLEENYRSHQHILDAASAIIRYNHDHIPRRLYSQQKSGEKIVVHEAYDERDEANFVVQTISDLINRGKYAPDDFAVMYRMNAQSRALEESFVQAGLPYLLVGATRFYERKEIKDALAYMRSVYNPNDWVNMSRIINTPPRGIGNTTLERFAAWAETLEGGTWEALQRLHQGLESPLSGRSQSSVADFAGLMHTLISFSEKSPLTVLDAVLDETGYWQTLVNDQTPQGIDRQENIAELRRVADEDRSLTLGQFLEKVALVSDVDSLNNNGKEAPTLLTLHSAKGLEFPVVFITGMEKGTLPHWRADEDPEQMAEERRLMYVGLTRAKERIYLAYAFRRMMYGSSDVTEPSEFIDMLPKEVVEGHTAYNVEVAAQSYQRTTTWEYAQTDKIIQFPTKKKKTSLPDAKFRSGQKVSHVKFGEGIVIKSEVTRDNEEVEVLFPLYGQKRIDSTYLQLKI